MDHTGHVLLKAWRESFAPTLSQAKAADRLDVSQPLIAEWEKGPRRPGLETAVSMEAETGGAVPVEAWGYDRSVVRSMAVLVDRRRSEGDRLDAPVSDDPTDPALDEGRPSMVA